MNSESDQAAVKSLLVVASEYQGGAAVWQPPVSDGCSAPSFAEVKA